MATKSAIGKKQAEALARLDTAMRAVNKSLQLRPGAIPRHVRGNDSELLRVLQLEAYADWAEKIARKLAKEGQGNEPDGDPTE